MINEAQARAFVKILLTDSPQMKGYLAATLKMVPDPDILSFHRMYARDERDDLLDLLKQVADALRPKRIRRRQQ